MPHEVIRHGLEGSGDWMTDDVDERQAHDERGENRNDNNRPNRRDVLAHWNLLDGQGNIAGQDTCDDAANESGTRIRSVERTRRGDKAGDKSRCKARPIRNAHGDVAGQNRHHQRKRQGT